MLPKTGRPPLDNPKREMLRIRVTADEKASIMAFSKESGVGLLDLLRIGIETVKKK